MSPVVEIDEWPRSFWTAFRLPRVVEDALAGGVPGLVHPFARRLAGCDDPGPFEASVPPPVEAVDAHRLVAVLDRSILSGGSFLFLVLRVPAGDGVLAAEQVLVRLRLPVEDVPLEVVPERGVDDRDRLHLRALREDGEASLCVVEVPELDALQCALCGFPP